MSPIVLLAGGLLLGGIAGFFAGRLAGSRGKLRDACDDEIRLRRQARELSAELRQAREEFAHEAATTASQIPFIVKKLGERMNPEAIPGIAVRIVKDLFRTPTAGYLRLKDPDGAFVLEEGIGFPPEWKGSRTFSASAGIAGAAVKQRIELAKEDYLAGRAQWPAPPSSLEEAGVFPDLVAPVVWEGRVHGLLLTAGSPVSLSLKRPYIAMLADMVAAAARNSVIVTEKDRQASTDPLTGLFNRARFDSRLAAEVGTARESMAHLSVLLFESDRCRPGADAHARPDGDAVLKRLAEIVVKSVRSTDVVARYEGGAIAVMLGATSKDQASAFAERLRETIARTSFPVPGLAAPLEVAVSIGVSGYPEDGDSPADLVKAAAAALSEATSAGRNRVVRAARNPDGLERV